ncbi:MAG TPA: hypothetical protein VJ373_04875 [Desulfatiglandales bacterium]|nr:hypothetical protein [Desulfatiglandales bacterium]
MTRSLGSQRAHDAEVRRIAERLKRQGFNVKADVEGFQKPSTFGGLRPDVVAGKGAQRKIYEVETKDSVDTTRNEKQKIEFRNVADRSKSTTFKRVII